MKDTKGNRGIERGRCERVREGEKEKNSYSKREK